MDAVVRRGDQWAGLAPLRLRRGVARVRQTLRAERIGSRSRNNRPANRIRFHPGPLARVVSPHVRLRAGLLGTVHVGTSESHLQEVVDTTPRFMVALTVFVPLVAVAVAFLLTALVTRPIRDRVQIGGEGVGPVAQGFQRDRAAGGERVDDQRPGRAGCPSWRSPPSGRNSPASRSPQASSS